MSHGAAFYGADGSPVNTLNEVFLRHVKTVRLAADFAGTVDEPEFDSTRGALYVSYDLFKYSNYITPYKFPKSASWATGDSSVPTLAGARAAGYFLPSLSWDNSTRQLTCTPAILPSGFSGYRDGVLPDYRVTFVHHRGGVAGAGGHGLLLKNQAGDVLFQDNPVFIVEERGVARPFGAYNLPGTLAGEMHASMDGAGIGSGYGDRTTGHSAGKFVATTGTGGHAYLDGIGIGTLPLYDHADMIFWDISGPGLTKSLKMHADIDDRMAGGAYAYCDTDTDTPPQFTRVGKIAGPATGAGDYGAMVRNATGDLILDSRHELFTVFLVWHLTKEEVQDILENDTAVDIPLGQAAPGMRVCAPFFDPYMVEFATGFYGAYWDRTCVLSLRQINDSTVRVSRHIAREDSGFPSWVSGVGKHFYQDVFLIFGRAV